MNKKVLPGEIFKVSVQNSFGKNFDAVPEFESFLKEKKIDSSPITWVEIETDRKPLSLAVRFLDLKATKGYQAISTDRGILKRFFEPSGTLHEVGKDQIFRFKQNDLCMRGSPKLGFIATGGESHDISENGGEIAFNFIDKESIVYLPVTSEKPLLGFGKLHICQGNGEVAGFGVEADGELLVQVTLVDQIPFPLIDHRDYFCIVGWGPSFGEAIESSTQNTIQFLRRVFPFTDWSEAELYKFISAEGNLTFGNSTGIKKSCAMVFYKKRITNKYFFPIL